MNECHQVESPLQVKVNEALAKSVRLRSRPGAPGVREVVVEDSWLGAFALSSQFDLSVKQEGSDWRAVTLDELRSILGANKHFLDAGEKASNHQTLELTPPGEPNEFAGARPNLVRLGTIIGLDACVQRIEAILYRASIPHLTAGSTFVVPCMVDAREHLQRAGFRQDQRYESVLFEPESGIAIRLLERAPRALQGE
jgi:hypothetical protein